MTLCLAVVALLARAVPAAARADVTLWVVQPPGEVVAFDPSNFSRVGGVRIPQAAFDDPARISINGLGQILVQLDAEHLWLWDGDAARTLPAAPDIGNSALGESLPSPGQWLLGDDGHSLYVLRTESTRDRKQGTDSARASLVLFATDLSQHPRERVAAMPLEPCQRHADEVADVDEPCPDPSLWAPGRVVRDYIVLTRWQQDSAATAFEGYPVASCHCTLYSRVKGWQPRDLEDCGDEPPAAADESGLVRAEIVGDGGCCAESNGSSDQAIITMADTGLVVFDEWPRFHNQNYEVSFFAANLRIAPGGIRTAYTLHATGAASAEIPVSPEGHADSLELASIRRSLAELPLVEAHGLTPQPVLLRRLAHAELVDWLSDSELLVVEKRRLVAIDVVSGRLRETGIAVRSAQDASVVRR